MVYDNEADISKAEELAGEVLLQNLGVPNDIPNQFVPQPRAPALDTDIRVAHNTETGFKKKENFNLKLDNYLSEAINL